MSRAVPGVGGEAMTDDEFEKLKQEMERVADYLQKSKEDLPPEAQEMVDDNFWELIDKEKP
ncbi:MAG: hypothetical protein EHM49_09955 [Deltaproteobacteria bacterium]|nr:MAG: hypothetical protein EHM49_09955 [Deltaproteobacteria bacterium]